MKRSLISFGAALALAMGVSTAQAASQSSDGPASMLAQAAAADKTPASARIDVNSASADELQTLKGIGPARADAIIAGRPYAGKDDLIRRKIVPQSVYDEIKDEIIARQK
ncbi:MAG TPA: helix-hairpin-helix domain-containing protein [Burkholderiaceae bacterium]|nr:helix-hairpin-helix domain-containing protein [Burkholderiaceae bacterium]